MRNLLSRAVPTLTVAGVMLTAGFFIGAEPKTYEVSGRLLDMNETSVSVDNNGARLDLERDINTKFVGSAHKEATVTVKYRMLATSIEIQP